MGKKMKNNMRFLKNLVMCLLLVGIVDQIEGDVAIIEYKVGGRILHTKVNLDLSPCTPAEGDQVSFFKDYKIVTCQDSI